MAVDTPVGYDRVNRWGAWTPYTPTWSSTGTQPAIGNGYLAADVDRDGSTARLRGVIKIGSTTSLGTGQWRVSLPDNWAASSALTSGYQMGHAACFGASTTDARCYIAPSGTVIEFVYGATWLSVTGSAPFAWGTNHFLSWNITIELEAPTYS